VKYTARLLSTSGEEFTAPPAVYCQRVEKDAPPHAT
jgi:hypothetical protein